MFTAAVFALALGLTVTLGSGTHASNVAGGILLTTAIALGPLIAWRLQGRRVNGPATGGALLGYMAGGAAVFLLMLLTALLAWTCEAIGLVSSGESVWMVPGLIVGGVVAVICLGVIVMLDGEAVRDLAPNQRFHVSLDVARLAATLVYIAYVVTVVAWASDAPDVGAVDLLVFLAGPSVVGAAVVTVADMTVRRGAQRARGHLVSMG